MKLSLVIPLYNEANKVEKDIQNLFNHLSSLPFHSEILAIDDGSNDSTREILHKLKEDAPHNVHYAYHHYSPNRGKGHAISLGVEKAEGEFIGFLDAGSCLAPEYIDKGMRILELGFDGVIGTRHSRESEFLATPSTVRRIGSFIFHKAMRLFFGIQVSDTQCGFKLFRREVAKNLFSQVKAPGFMFDIETLALCAHHRYQIQEMGVKWSTDRDSRFRLVKGSLQNMRELWQIKQRIDALE